MPYPNLQALVDGKGAARWPELREEAKASLAELERLTEQRRFDRARIGILARRPSSVSTSDIDDAIYKLNLDEAAWLAANPDPVQEHIRDLKTELERFRRVYNLFEECSPPLTSLPQFVRDCFDAWETQCEVEQAYQYLFQHRWILRLSQCADGKHVAVTHNGLVSADGSTPAEAIIQLAARVAELQENSKAEGT